MLVYKVYRKNYNLKKGDLIGVLIERRKDLRGLGKIESGLKWAKMRFGNDVEDKKEIFVIPHELNLRINFNWLREKGIFTKDELLTIIKLVE